MMRNQVRVLVDTCVLLEDPAVLIRIRQRGGLPFLTGTVLDELDYNKDVKKRASRPASKVDELRAEENARSARLIFREFNNSASSRLNLMPTGEPLLESDVLTQFMFKDGPVFLISRELFRAQSNNDAKIIELAKDYKMVLITRDTGMKVRAEAQGVDVAFWTGPEQPQQRHTTQNTRSASQGAPIQRRAAGSAADGPRPFATCTSPVRATDAPLRVSKIPATGDTVKLGDGRQFQLGALISAGGEGSIYETEVVGQVCKIYHQTRLTTLKKRKIELMVSRRIDRPGICWPAEIVLGTCGEFVGYLMPRASGTTMQKAMFVKPVLEKKFPNWRRRDLVSIATVFVDHIRYLHSLNIIVGDINPLNLLVTEDSSKLWMVDTDSFQIEGFPCPVGTVNFTPPEIQGQNYADFLRTKNHELFAVATMVFMILFPGKPPYSQQGGGTPSDNIKSKNFPYPYFRAGSIESKDRSLKNAPQGTWQFIWGNLPNPIREAFFSTFSEDQRTSIEEWATLLLRYGQRLKRGDLTDELFPLGFKVKDPVQIACAECSAAFTASQRWVEKLKAENKPSWCPECANRIRVQRLAAQSRRAALETVGHPGRGTPPGASGRSWGMGHGSSPSYQKRSPQPTSGNGGGILGAVLRFIFK